MILYKFAAEIALWRDRRGGRSPKQIRVPKAIAEALSTELDDWCVKFSQSRLQRFQICGVPIVVDETLTIGTYDE